MYASDIPRSTAVAAFQGTSFNPERRADLYLKDYSATLEADLAEFKRQAERGGTTAQVEAEFERYRAGYRKAMCAWFASESRCVSSMIAGPSNFPVARMRKRMDVAHKRMGELINFRARARGAILRRLRPDLAPIMAGDPDALERLDAELVRAEAAQVQMKAANLAIRRTRKEGQGAQVAALMALGYSETAANRLLTPDFCKRIGFASYQLTNNGANIRRIKARIEQITAARATPASKIEGAAAVFEDCPADNRVRLTFPGKPDADVRAKLKTNGFRWAPSLGVWQAYRKQRAYDLAKQIAGVAA